MQHWRGEDKEVFARLPHEAQEFVLRKDREFQSDYTRKMQSVADLKHALDPVRQEIEQFGVTEGDAVRRLIGAHLMLRQDPAKGIRYVAEQYGVDLGNLGAAPAQEDSAVRSELDSIRQHLLAREQAAYVQRVQGYQREIEEVKKDAPFFEELEPDMERIARAYVNSGEQPPDVRSLYDQAAWANPAVRAKLLKHQQATEAKNRIETEKARVRKAKKAASATVRSTTTGEEKAKSKPQTLRDMIEAQMDQAEQG